VSIPSLALGVLNRRAILIRGLSRLICPEGAVAEVRRPWDTHTPHTKRDHAPD